MVKDECPQDPGMLLRAVPLPVQHELIALALLTNVNEPAKIIGWVAVDEPGGWWGRIA